MRRLIDIISIPILALSIAGCSSAHVVGQGGTLQGICWELVQMNGSPIPPQGFAGQIAIAFDKNGEVNGHTAINEYWAKYAATGSQLTVTYLAMTAIEDSPEGATYNNLLPTVYSYTASNGQLILYDSTGTSILEYKSVNTSICSYP